MFHFMKPAAVPAVLYYLPQQFWLHTSVALGYPYDVTFFMGVMDCGSDVSDKPAV